MSYFKAKMYQVRFRLGLCARPHWGSLQHFPRPLAGFKDPTSKGRGGEGKEKGRGEEMEEYWREGRDFDPRSPKIVSVRLSLWAGWASEVMTLTDCRHTTPCHATPRHAGDTSRAWTFSTYSVSSCSAQACYYAQLPPCCQLISTGSAAYLMYVV